MSNEIKLSYNQSRGYENTVLHQEPIKEQDVLDKKVFVYGTEEHPLFLAKDVAEWIGHNKPSEMISAVDPEEKQKAILSHSGQRREMWFLTEDGLYEVLMQSRKPIAKAFKKEIKKILKEIRRNGMYEVQRPQLPQSPMEIMELMFTALKDTNKDVAEVKADLENYKENSPLYNIECDELQKSVKKKAVYLLGGRDSKAYKDKSLRQQVFGDLQSQIKREFRVSSYKAIKRSQLSVAIEIVENYKLPHVLEQEVYWTNNQLSLI